jgi:hypothetical protein
MQFDMIGGSYGARYTSVNPRRTINWYVHKQQTDQKDKTEEALYPFSGLSAFATLTGSTTIYRLFNARTLVDDRLFAVGDNILYEIDNAGTVTNRGTMTDMTGTTAVWMAVNGNRQMMIANEVAGYTFDLSTNTLAKITDGDYPSSVKCLTYMQGYFIVVSGGRIYFSNLNDGAAWTATDVFTPTSWADNTVAAIAWRDEIHCFGSETIEVYRNDGATPFIQVPGRTIPVGLVSATTINAFSDGFIFLGRTRWGQVNVYFYDGQNCVILSDPVGWNINTIQGTSISEQNWDDSGTYTWDQWAMPWGSTSIDLNTSNLSSSLNYSKDGHIFWYIHLPATSTTYVYDITTKEWTERRSLSSGSQATFRGNWCVNYQGLTLWGDTQTNKILKEDFSITTENSTAIYRELITPPLWNDNLFLSIYSLEFVLNAGENASNLNLLVYVSKDGGYTYGTAKSVSLGSSTSYTYRPRLTKLGTARSWAFKIVLQDSANIALQSMIVNGVVESY